MKNFARLSNTDVFVFTKVVIRLVRVDMQLAVVDVDERGTEALRATQATCQRSVRGPGNVIAFVH